MTESGGREVMMPFYEADGISLFLGDCRAIMAQMVAACRAGAEQKALW